MPIDTAWFGMKGSYLLIDSGQTKRGTLFIQLILKGDATEQVIYSQNSNNSPFADKVLRDWIKNSNTKTEFEIEKEYYDNLGDKLEGLLILAFLFLIFYALFRLDRKKKNPYGEDDNDWVEIGTRKKVSFGEEIEPTYKPTYSFLTYKGKNLNFSEAEIVAIFTRRFPFFTNLSQSEKIRFLNRHKRFMKNKTFRIHDRSGFKEMPILISATAVQVSFGLEEYLLQHYKCINIFPEEFLGVHPTIRFLEGNVSGDTINISWKHFLLGNENSTNGQNVGLHEMAHAYYCQNIICEQDRDLSFSKSYDHFHTHGDNVFKIEKITEQRLYTDYALKNLQEFWAESVEIFFERPTHMKKQYPELYSCMQTILNQSTS